METTTNNAHGASAHKWAIAIAFAILYVAWGTTYLAIKKGVKDEALPPALFGGTRVFVAGLGLLAYLAWRGQPIQLSREDFRRIAITGALLFIGGNGLLTASERTVPSGVASILAATTPIWVAVIGAFLPSGDRLNPLGWIGLMLGFAGVFFLVIPELNSAFAAGTLDYGPLLLLGSTLSWALGMLYMRHSRTECPHLVSAAYQMIIGGGGLTVLGLVIGEVNDLPHTVTPGAVASFVYLLIVGSWLGFIAFNFLLRHVSAAQVGTHAYVNPIVAIFLGWLIDGEAFTLWVAVGVVTVLAGVYLLRCNVKEDATQPTTNASDETNVRISTSTLQAENGEFLPAGAGQVCGQLAVHETNGHSQVPKEIGQGLAPESCVHVPGNNR